MPCKSCNIPYEFEGEKSKENFEKISLDKLKGWDRPDGIDKVNWLECLDGLHKMINFQLYESKEQFEAF